jgi:hypothetical protein
MASKRLDALEARFGKKAESWYLGQEGDFVIGVVRSVGSMTTEYGPAPFLDFIAEEGEGTELDNKGQVAAVHNAEKGTAYKLVFLGEVMKGQFQADRFLPGTRFLALHRGMQKNKAGTQEYKNVEVLAPYVD